MIRKLRRVEEMTGMQNQKHKETASIVEILVISLVETVRWQENVSTLEKLNMLLETVFSQEGSSHES